MAAVSVLSIALIFFAIGAGSLAKGKTGLGLRLIALPVLTFFLGLLHAIGVLLMPIMVTIQAVQMRTASPDVRFMGPMPAMSVPGVAVGTWVLVVLSEEMLMACGGAGHLHRRADAVAADHDPT